MKFLIFLALLCSQCLSLPIPSGQVIKYRVSSKYFSRPNVTSSSTDNSLYELLSQIHYGPKEQPTSEAPSAIVSEEVTTLASELHLQDISNDNKNNDGDVTTVINSVANEYPETVTTQGLDDVPATTDEQPISMEIIKVNSDISDVANNAETGLIEKVAEEKLATEADLAATEASTDNSNDDLMEEEEIKSSLEMTTISDSVEAVTEETNADEKVSDEEENEGKVPESLLSAVGDLLSSVLGLNIGLLDDAQKTDVGDSQALQEATEAPSEQPITLESTVSSADEEILPASEANVDHNPTSEVVAPVVNEVDLKIENLASAETSFVTESTPEVYAEPADTVKEHSDVKDESDDDKIVLETLSELSTINDDGDEEPVSFEDSVNHVMSLVRGTEGNLALQAAQNVVDSILIDKHMDDSVGDLDQIVYGTLKEIETNLGLNGDEDKNLPTDSFEPLDQQREEMIKNFETDINESLRLTNPEDYESLDIEPNPAKAAMYYKFQYGDDF